MKSASPGGPEGCRKIDAAAFREMAAALIEK
jgi:hypothetical protein